MIYVPKVVSKIVAEVGKLCLRQDAKAKGWETLRTFRQNNTRWFLVLYTKILYITVWWTSWDSNFFRKHGESMVKHTVPTPATGMPCAPIQGCTQSCNGAQCHKLLQPTTTLSTPPKRKMEIMKLKIMENGFLELLFRKQLSGSKVGFFQARMSGETDSFCQDYWVECIIQWITRWRRRMPAYQSNITRHQS